MRETFANEYLACAMAANAMYENKYPDEFVVVMGVAFRVGSCFWVSLWGARLALRWKGVA